MEKSRSERKFTAELSYDELAIIVVSLELREMNHTFNSRRDEATAKKLSERLRALFNEAG